MSTYYVYTVSEEPGQGSVVRGPFDMDTLLMMEAAGTLLPESPIRFAEREEWTTWEKIRPAPIPAPPEEAPSREEVFQIPPVSATLKSLRHRSNYGLLRVICVWLIGIDVISFVIFFLMGICQMVGGSSPSFLIAAAVAASGSFALWFGIVFLDLVDSAVILATRK